MENIKLGNLEELILLLVALLYDKAYSVSIIEEYEKQTGKSINISAIHTVLYRLEKKGYLESRLGDAKAERGGKRKRLFYLTTEGKKALEEMQALRDQIRDKITSLAFPSNV